MISTEKLLTISDIYSPFNLHCRVSSHCPSVVFFPPSDPVNLRQSMFVPAETTFSPFSDAPFLSSVCFKMSSRSSRSRFLTESPHPVYELHSLLRVCRYPQSSVVDATAVTDNVAFIRDAHLPRHRFAANNSLVSGFTGALKPHKRRWVAAENTCCPLAEWFKSFHYTIYCYPANHVVCLLRT